MKNTRKRRSAKFHARTVQQRPRRRKQQARPANAYRQRGLADNRGAEPFYAPEDWHEPTGQREIRYVVQPAGKGFVHSVTVDEVRERLALLPERFTRPIEVIQFSRMTRKRALFPCYGMQWGQNIYLYPIEESFVEAYERPPGPEQLIEARMFGGKWSEHKEEWRLAWTQETVKDFYLNNVLIHEVGHVLDNRNSNCTDRERYANWFAIEYGYRASRGRR